MIKKIKDLSDLIKFDTRLGDDKKISDINVDNVLKIVNQTTDLNLDKNIFLIKKNIYKIKTDSTNRFIILLHLKEIQKNINNLNQNIILEL